MEIPGAKLKQIRLEKGFSLEEAQKRTKIHLNVLKAIEEDSLVNFSPIYIKGFIKIYCIFLGVDPKDFITDYKPVRSIKEVVTQPKERKEANSLEKKKINLDFFKFICSKIKIILILIVIIAAVFILVNLVKFISGKISIFLSRRPRAAAVLSKKEAKRAVFPKTAKIKEEPAVSLKQHSSLDLSSEVRLGIRARQDCWVMAKRDGKVIFQNMLRRGRSESWQAKEKFELSLGNAGAVDLEVNGRLIPSLGRRGQAVKNIVITKDGLSTPR